MNNRSSRDGIRAALNFAAGLALALAGCAPDSSAPDGGAASIDFNVGVAALSPGAEPPRFAARAVFDEIPGKAGSHAPTIAVLPDGELLCAWFSYNGPGELTGSAIYMARRPPGAATWASPVLHGDRTEGGGNPVLYAEGENVWLFHATAPFGWSTANVFVQRSSDGGKTWSAAQTLGAFMGTNVRFPPIRLNDGTLLLPAYSDLIPRAEFYVSSDGDRWAQRSVVAPVPAALQPSVVELPEGRLLAVMRNLSKGWLWVAASDDAGRTWTPPRDSGFPNPGSAAALARLESGRLILVFNDHAVERRDLSIALSSDEGATWTPPRVLVANDGELAYPSVAQSPDGVVHVVYSHDRRRIGHIEFNEAWILRARTSP